MYNNSWETSKYLETVDLAYHDCHTAQKSEENRYQQGQKTHLKTVHS